MLVEVTLHTFVKIGAPTVKYCGPFEEELADSSKKLLRTFAGCIIEDVRMFGALSALKSCELPFENIHPVFVLAAIVNARGAIKSTILQIKMVGKFMVNDI